MAFLFVFDLFWINLILVSKPVSYLGFSIDRLVYFDFFKWSHFLAKSLFEAFFKYNFNLIWIFIDRCIFLFQLSSVGTINKILSVFICNYLVSALLFLKKTFPMVRQVVLLDKLISLGIACGKRSVAAHSSLRYGMRI